MEHKGSVSAEHGLGQLKKAYLPQTKSKEVVGVMRGMKKMLDPKGILNPGKFFPDDA
jgi:FAD/FMN-containing dehydrogenase